MIELILFIVFFQTPNDRVINCTLVKPNEADCVDGKKEYVVRRIDWEDKMFEEWLWQSEHPNAKPVKVIPKVGDKLKVGITPDGGSYPVASCQVRLHRKMQDWANEHPGQSPPLHEEPKDCWASEQPKN